eukprot:8669871-Pyramimonas_sp.AAC.2
MGLWGVGCCVHLCRQEDPYKGSVIISGYIGSSGAAAQLSVQTTVAAGVPRATLLHGSLAVLPCAV